MAVSEVRTQIYLERDQHEALKRTARKRSVSMARLVREAISSYLAGGESATSDPMDDDGAYLADPAWQIPEVADEIGGSNGREDASRLEEELYGPVAT